MNMGLNIQVILLKEFKILTKKKKKGKKGITKEPTMHYLNLLSS